MCDYVPFLAYLHSKFAISAKMTKNIYEKNQYSYKKVQLRADFKFIGTGWKNIINKVPGKNTLKNMKNWIAEKFRGPITFFLVIY